MLEGMRLYLSKKRLANLREASSWFQYQLSASCRPSVLARPRLCTSLMNTSRPATFMVLVMPNSLAAFMALVKSPPALAIARIWALDDWACSRNEEKSDALSGWRTEPATVPPLALTTLVASLSSEAPKA